MHYLVMNYIKFTDGVLAPFFVILLRVPLGVISSLKGFLIFGSDNNKKNDR